MVSACKSRYFKTLLKVWDFRGDCHQGANKTLSKKARCQICGGSSEGWNQRLSATQRSVRTLTWLRRYWTIISWPEAAASIRGVYPYTGSLGREHTHGLVQTLLNCAAVLPFPNRAFPPLSLCWSQTPWCTGCSVVEFPAEIQCS